VRGHKGPRQQSQYLAWFCEEFALVMDFSSTKSRGREGRDYGNYNTTILSESEGQLMVAFKNNQSSNYLTMNNIR
jgi:hypothetical protein